MLKVGGILYGIGIFADKLLFPDFPDQFGRIYFSGFVGLAIMAICFLIGYGIYCAIKENWEWADKLSKKRGN